MNSDILTRMMKQTIKLLKNPLILLIIGIFISLSILGVRVILQENRYVTVEMIASGGDWWQTIPQTPHWLADAVVPGATEYSAGNKKLAEILETKKYQEDTNKIMWTKVKLLVTPDKTRGGWRFRQMPLEIGSTLTIEPNNVKLTGSVIAIEDVGQAGEYKNLIVLVKIYFQHPCYADAIQPGLEAIDDQGNVTARIIDKRTELAETVAYTADGRVLSRQNPLYRDIILTIKIQTVERNGLLYFNQVQPVKIGNKIWIHAKNINIWEANILDISEDQ